jgi:hypothetical protein
VKCFDKTGHVTKVGTPCQQTIGADAAGCIWYVRTPEQRSVLALKGGIASRMRSALPSTYQVPEFTDPEAIVRFAQELARMALKDDVDRGRVAEARMAAGLALSAHAARTQQQLVDALLRIEHGGLAVAMLAQFQAAQSDPSKRRPLPPRIVTSLPLTGAEPA